MSTKRRTIPANGAFAAPTVRHPRRRPAGPGRPHQSAGRRFPFTRGIQRDMYRGRPWTMRQYAGFGTASESNRRFRFLLARGVTGLSVAFDLPTQIGYDSDHPARQRRSGACRRGNRFNRGHGRPARRDSTRPRVDVDDDQRHRSHPARPVRAVAKRHGTPIQALSGTLQNDILKEYVARGTYIYPPRPSLRIVTDVIAFCEREMPHWNPISISGYHIREAGATAVQEVAFTLAHGCEYVNAAVNAGLDVNAVGRRISFFFNAHNDFIEEIAKFRAARRLWARLMRDRFGATNPRAQQLRFHAQTAGSTLTAQQPDNNIVRVALQALAAVLGGAQSLHCNSRDEALSLPTEDSVTIALRTQQIILHESGVANTVDPVGGAYAIEALTDRIEREAADLIASIDAKGGALRAIESQYIQRQIQEAAYRTQREIDSGEAVVVGMNRFANPDAERVAVEDVFRVDPESERRQIERVRAVRSSRSQQAWRGALAGVEQAARDGSNLVPPIIAAVEAHATLGEIADTLRHVFGEYQDSSGA